jgi:hypothetical protein
MKEKKEKVFRTFNQYIRPKIPQNIGSRYYRGNNKPIDVCRYHDTYDVGIGYIFSDYTVILHKEYSLKKDGFSVVRRKCANPYCRFCPHIRHFRLADGKLYTSPTAADFRRTLPDGPRMVNTYMDMKRRVEKLIRFEKEISWLNKFEKNVMEELSLIIDYFSKEMREADQETHQYDAYHFRWAQLQDLPEQEIVGPYTPLWGARLDQALVLLRGAYEEVRRGLHAFYYGRLGGHSNKWSELLFPVPAHRTVGDVPRYQWRYIVFSKTTRTITYKSHLLVGGKGGVKIKRLLKGQYPSQADLAPWRYQGLRSNILAYAHKTRQLDQLGDLLNRLIRSAKKGLPALGKIKRY